jgi:uncharacterized membrane protein
MSARRHPYAGLDKRRVENLTDGIFGTVMTILGLSLSVPYLVEAGQPNPPAINFPGLAIGVAVYAMSFVFLGVYWVGHHFALEFVRTTDRQFIWLNNSFLLCIGLLPLTTALLGVNPIDQVRLIIYGVNLIAVGLTLLAATEHAISHEHIDRSRQQPEFISSARRRILTGPAIAGVAILLSFIAPIASLLTFVVMPIPFIFPGRIDAFVRRVEEI